MRHGSFIFVHWSQCIPYLRDAPAQFDASLVVEADQEV
jgi:hypothetical protein